MYEPYPVSGQVPGPQRIPPPRSVQNAVKLMYAGAAVEVIALVVALITRNSIKSALLKIHPNYTAAQLHSAVTVQTISLVIGAAVATGLWLWMAWANGRGHNWARILSAVFFGISTLDLLITFAAERAPGSLIVGFVIWLVGLGAIVLLFSRESNAFFRQPPAFR
jgi:multisubunit Na+/H+ antiporter MnhB subunit